ncbi:GNAT family N-acetyltransferase [Dermacoccus sp. PE3]|uniref:GNAT family N-acetyltransferase n=1 Tax=Dermacoccus sp. PE3 TaxID=1641401 RepID=UPI00069AC1A5|nr:GNAT family N-acetyltransferase [Dermacoccus sp. PE3]
MNIRAGRLDDDAILAAIDHASWSPLSDPSEHWSIERPFFGPPTGTRPQDVLVAEVGPDLVGVIKIVPATTEFGDWCINGLAVAAAFGGRGVGTALIRAACAKAGAAGGAQVWLKVLDSNARAVRLYECLGFVEVARFTSPFENRPGVDDLRMAADLPLESG